MQGSGTALRSQGRGVWLVAITGTQCPQLLHCAVFHQHFWMNWDFSLQYPALFFYWACPIDSGSRHRANRLEKHSLSHPRHISLHHSHSAEKRKVSPVPSSLLIPLPVFSLSPTLTCEGSLTKLSVTLLCISVVVSAPLTLPADWNCCHSKSIRNGS